MFNIRHHLNSDKGKGVSPAGAWRPRTRSASPRPEQLSHGHEQHSQQQSEHWGQTEQHALWADEGHTLGAARAYREGSEDSETHNSKQTGENAKTKAHQAKIFLLFLLPSPTKSHPSASARHGNQLCLKSSQGAANRPLSLFIIHSLTHKRHYGWERLASVRWWTPLRSSARTAHQA